VGSTTEQWRTEADDEWLARHRSNRFAQIRRLLGGTGGLLAGAVSEAELGPFRGAPRKPKLKTDEAEYSVIRPVAHGIAHMTIATVMDPQHCRRCGQTVEVHGMTRVGPDGERVDVGSVQECRRCGADSWQLRSHMPAVERFRRQARKTVL
jgi:ribosomal protein L37E